jgi:multidrug resistance efflux pump
MPSGGSLAEKALSNAATNLKESQAAMVATQETYLKSTESLAKIQTRLGELKEQLEKLKADSITLEHIRAILLKCIDVICDLKVQIGKLVQFFDALATIVSFAADYHVAPFLADLDKIIGGLPQEPGINGFTSMDLQRQASSRHTFRVYTLIVVERF